MSLAWHGIRLRKRMRTSTFWLALVHILLMCYVKLRFLSIFTPNSLICSVFMISSLAMVRTLPFLSASMFLGLIVRDCCGPSIHQSPLFTKYPENYFNAKREFFK